MDHTVGTTMIWVLILLAMSAPKGTVGIPVQVLPEGIQSVNGSSTDMGCTSALVDSGDVMTCNSQSYLVDGCSPDIDTSTSDWASQLVTVRRNEGTDAVPFDYVLLTFGFDTAVSLTGIEIDLFHCPNMRIGAPVITVFLNEGYDLMTFSTNTTSSGLELLKAVEPSESICDSLSSFTISETSDMHYLVVHILITILDSNIDWVYVGEVRFIGDSDTGTCMRAMSTTTVPSPTTSATPSASSNTPSESPSSTSSSTTNDSTSTTATTASSSSSTDPTVLIVIVAIIAAIVVVLLVILIILCVVVRKRRSAQAKLEMTQAVIREGGGEVELKDVEQERDEYTADNPLYSESTPVNGHQPETTHYQNTGKDLVADNPHYYTTPVEPGAESEVTDGLYTVVDSEKKSTLKAAPPPPPADDKTYASISEIKRKSPSPAAPGDMPVYAMVDKGKKSKAKKKPPDIVNDSFPEGDPFDIPALPPKSPDLQVYLSTQEVVPHPLPLPTSSNKPSKVSTLPDSLAVGMSSNPNYESADDALSDYSQDADSALYAQPYLHTAPSASAPSEDGDIYSEPIQPSDFAAGAAKLPEELGGGEDGPRIYSGIYTVATTKESVEKPLEITHDNIKEMRDLGMGQFGKVVLAQTIDLSLKDMGMSENNRIISVLVAVKKLRSKASSAEREAFDKEIKFMSRLNHPNVVRFLGVCYNDPAFIIMEYMEKGDLSFFLQQYSEIVDVPANYSQIVTSSIVKMALQIASGMNYLASKNFVHRDLASRNCLVDEKCVVKLADFGMSRNLYESHYYKIKGNAILPIRWMATECFYGTFSEKTDVWAYGITLWELFTLAKEKPYPHLADSEVVDDAVNRAADRFIHPKPPACPQPVYEVMLRCWVADRKQRATFEVLHGMLQKLMYM